MKEELVAFLVIFVSIVAWAIFHESVIGGILFALSGAVAFVAISYFLVVKVED